MAGLEGKRAIGVEFIRKGKLVRIHADREVILSAGAFNTPQLLMLSGIGDPEVLHRFGIEVTAELTGVGRNLQDHLDCSIQYECTQPITFYDFERPFHRLKAGLEYMLLGTGPATGQGLEAGAYLKSDPGLAIPDLQFHFIAALMFDHTRKKADRHGFMAHACQLRPSSRGYISLKSDDPLAAPLIQPDYLSAEGDIAVLRQGVKIAREVFAQSAFDPYRGPELMPGAAVRHDAEIDAFIRKSAETIYHPAGTAKMGVDGTSVVDTALRVYGVDGLRVADASVMPVLVSGNTNAPVIMIAEKAADLILGRSALPA